MACIYCITNKNNGKRYVGKTSGCHMRRWRSHVKAAEEGADLLLSRAIRKHGSDSFMVDVLETCNNAPDIINERERHWIATLHTYMNDEMGSHGYNMTPGGDGASARELLKPVGHEVVRDGQLWRKVTDQHKNKQARFNFKPVSVIVWSPVFVPEHVPPPITIVPLASGSVNVRFVPVVILAQLSVAVFVESVPSPILSVP